MTDYLGDFAVGGHVYYWDTFFASEVPTNIVGATAAVYKQGTNVESSAGVTVTMPYDGRAGFIHVDIDLAANTTFYAAQGEFACILTAGTLDGIPQTPRTLFRFSIARQLAALQDVLVGPQFTVVANGSNSPTTFQIDVPGVTELDANWWNGALLSFDLTANVAGQYRKATGFNLGTSMVTVDTGYTRTPATGSSGRMEYR